MFNSPNVFYSNNPQTIYDNNWLVDLDKVKSLKKHKLCVLDFSSENYGIGDWIYEIYQTLEQNNVNFILLTHDPKNHLWYPKLLHYSHWYYDSITEFKNSQDHVSNKRKYKWSCMNLTPRPHRIFNFLLLRIKDYYKDGAFTMHREDASRCNRPDDIILNNKHIDEWNSILPTLPPKSDTSSNGRDLNIPQLTDSYIHLVTESTIINKIFVTEKTWKPIASKQLFLIFGNPGIVNYLRNIGVDVFDDVVDHSYDIVEDWENRLKKIHHSLEKLLSMDLENIYNMTNERRQRNFDLFWSEQFATQYKLDLMSKINFYRNI
jgi:hypothetical protein